MRILVAEDEPDLLRSLALALRDEGYAVDTAATGTDALFKALEVDYDTLIVDLMLPELDGFSILARLRTRKNTPVLLLTARDSTADRVRGLDAGADDYLVKPFDLPELLARVRALLRRSSGNPKPILEAGGVLIDPASKKVTLHGGEIPLTAREYALVEYLVRNKNTVVSRTALYEHLFDESEDSLSNLLDVHVSNIRKKLGHDFIVTRRGHGYSIES
jgi:two-component system OmpR family response regulator